MKTENLHNEHPAIIHNGINYDILVESPSETQSPLQIVCFFDYKKNQYYQGGTDAVNQHFNGEINAIRRNGLFSGYFLETLLIIPNGQIPAKKLLLLGLGDPKDLSFERLEQVGYCAALEALKVKVASFCFAPSLKDAGIQIAENLDVSNALPRGMAKAISTAIMLYEKKIGDEPTLKEIFLLAGKPQAEHAYQGLAKAFL